MMLKGWRTRWSREAMSACMMPKPTRRPERPNALEKVRRVTTAGMPSGCRIKERTSIRCSGSTKSI
ncbi:hypothetical protein H206_05496 [Candidatus Electrothrix aarhusensis]|uniref:Uncharacterized protein n=1 Tax=Candidatus Electrothrix aarhusensis TaxID=1859131 RepID=A0A444J479_9BACT|nr:hypothetical protein H206_05496 [Candidatus Electrothrix aarhusensis]